MGKLLRVGRLQFLVPGLAIYLIGTLWALQQGARFSLPAVAVGALVVLPAQLSVHFSNDYFDVGSDARGHATLISGGGGVLLDHPELRPLAKRIAVGLILLSLAAGVFLIWIAHASPWFFVLMVVGNLIGWFYSAPPLRFSHGKGEWCYPLLGGFLTPALGYLALKGRLDTDGLFLVIPLLLITLASVVAVEIPDLEADRQGNKPTWVMRNGRATGFVAMGVLLAAASAYFFASPPFFPAFGAFQPWVMGLISFIPLSIGLTGLVRRPEEPILATRLATLVVFSCSAFCLLADGYLLWLALLKA